MGDDFTEVITPMDQGEGSLDLFEPVQTAIDKVKAHDWELTRVRAILGVNAVGTAISILGRSIYTIGEALRKVWPYGGILPPFFLTVLLILEMTTQYLVWDVDAHQTTEDKKIQLVKALLDQMTEEQLRSRVFHELYIQFHNMSDDELVAYAKTHDIVIESFGTN